MVSMMTAEHIFVWIEHCTAGLLPYVQEDTYKRRGEKNLLLRAVVRGVCGVCGVRCVLCALCCVCCVLCMLYVRCCILIQV